MSYIEQGDAFEVKDNEGFIEVIGQSIEPPSELHIVNETVSGLEIKEHGGDRGGKILTWAKRPIRVMMENGVISPLN